MKYLLDTCVLSELMKPAPDGAVVRWLSSLAPEDVYISVFTVAEISRGIMRMVSSRRRDELVCLFEEEIVPKYRRQIVTWDVRAAEIWAKIFTDGERTGRKPSIFDSQIAATALAHGMTMVTRNVDDFQFEGLAVINPFESA